MKNDIDVMFAAVQAAGIDEEYDNFSCAFKLADGWVCVQVMDDEYWQVCEFSQGTFKPIKDYYEENGGLQAADDYALGYALLESHKRKEQ